MADGVFSSIIGFLSNPIVELIGLIMFIGGYIADRKRRGHRLTRQAKLEEDNERRD